MRRFWEGFLGKGSQKGSEKGACYGFYSKKGFSEGLGACYKFCSKKRVLRRGSEKGLSRRCLERPLQEYTPLSVRPSPPQAGNRCDFRHLNKDKSSSASDCDLILRFPSENCALSAEFPCDLTPTQENHCDCDSRLWCAQSVTLSPFLCKRRSCDTQPR